MSIDGIWTGEVYGAFGWETRGIFVFEKGRVISGDHRSYSAGTYELSGDKVTTQMNVTYYGPPRTVYGEKSEKFTLAVDATLKDGTIEGWVRRPDKAGFELPFRLTKRMDLPPS